MRKIANEDGFEDVQESGSEWEDVPVQEDSVFVNPAKNEEIKGRTYVKNFGLDPQSQKAVLKRLNPGLEFAIGDSREILYKRPGDTQWGYLDKPIMESLTDPSELWEDVKDVWYDVARGIVQGGATAAGAITGGLPGAMLGGAKSAAGMEALRQAAAKAYGAINPEYQQDLDPAQMIWETAAGGAFPLIGGGGVSARAAIEAAKKQGLKGSAIEAAKDTILKNQRGLPGRSYDYLFREKGLGPWLGSKISPASPNTVAYMRENLPQMKEWEQNIPQYAEYLDTQRQKIVSGIKDFAKKEWDSAQRILGKTYERTGPIKTKTVIGPFNELMDMLEYEGKDLPIPKQARKDLKAVIKKHFYTTEGERRKKIDLFEARRLKRDLDDAAKGMNLEKSGQLVGPMGPKVGQRSGDLAAATAKTAQNLEEAIEQKTKEAKFGRAYKKHKENYGNIQDLEESINTSFKTPWQYENFLNSISSSPAKGGLQDQVKKATGMDLLDESTKSRALNTFGKFKDKNMIRPEDTATIGWLPTNPIQAARLGMGRGGGRITRGAAEASNILRKFPAMDLPELGGLTKKQKLSLPALGAEMYNVTPYWGLFDEKDEIK